MRLSDRVRGAFAELCWWARLLRVQGWFYFVPLPLLAVEAPEVEAVLAAAPAMLLAAACLAYAYGLNNIADASLDSSASKNPLCTPTGTRRLRVARYLLAAIPVVAVGIAWLSGPFVLLTVTFQLVGSTLYSTGPRLKRIPIVGTLTNLWIFGPLCLLGGDTSTFTPSLLLFVGVFCALLIQNQLLHEVSEFEEDRAGSVRTTAVAFGKSTALVGSAAMGLVGAVLICVLGHQFDHAFLFAAESLPVLAMSGRTVSRMRVGPINAQGLRREQRVMGAVCGAIVWLTYLHLNASSGVV